MSAKIRTCEKRATVLAFILKIISMSTERVGKKRKRKCSYLKYDFLKSEEPAGTVCESMIQFQMNAPRIPGVNI